MLFRSLPTTGRTSTRGGQIDTGIASAMGDPMQEARRGAPVHDALAAMTGGGGPSYGNTGSSFGGGTRSGVPSGSGHGRTGYQPTNTAPLTDVSASDASGEYRQAPSGFFFCEVIAARTANSSATPIEPGDVGRDRKSTRLNSSH